MGQSSSADGGDAADAQPEPPRARFLDRLLWGTDAPRTADERARRWDRASRDIDEILDALD